MMSRTVTRGKVKGTGSTRLMRAEELGYIVKGWHVEDYLRDAVNHFNWESLVLWGPKGGGKSNLLLQLGFLVYQDWETVLDRIVFAPSDFIRITEEGGRIPWLGWDDIGVHLPKSLYFTDRKLWSAFKRNWDAYRVNLNVFCCTTPRKSKIVSFILEDCTGEVFLAKRVGKELKSKFDFQRWMWSLDFKHPLRGKFEMIRVEKTKLPYTPKEAYGMEALRQRLGRGGRTLPGVPKPIFMRYWKRRVEVAKGAREELVMLMKILEEAPEVEPEPVPILVGVVGGRPVLYNAETKQRLTPKEAERIARSMFGQKGAGTLQEVGPEVLEIIQGK